jgi:hypothetical protein
VTRTDLNHLLCTPIHNSCSFHKPSRLPRPSHSITLTSCLKHSLSTYCADFVPSLEAHDLTIPFASLFVAASMLRFDTTLDFSRYTHSISWLWCLIALTPPAVLPISVSQNPFSRRPLTRQAVNFCHSLLHLILRVLVNEVSFTNKPWLIQRQCGNSNSRPFVFLPYISQFL